MKEIIAALIPVLFIVFAATITLQQAQQPQEIRQRAAETTALPTNTAPTLITPTVYCVGGSGQPPCASLSPTAAIIPTSANATSTPATSTPPAGGTTPTTIAASPIPSTSPCAIDSTSGVLHDKDKDRKKSNGGIIDAFMRFIIEFLRFLLEMLGIQIPNPNPGGNPVPTQTPGGMPNPTQNPSPTQNPGGNPSPSQSPAASPTPCPEPTITPAPTQAAQPTSAPTPTAITQPTTAPTVRPTTALDPDGFTPHAQLPSGPFSTCRPTITIDSAAAPDLDAWLRTKVTPKLQDWYPAMGTVLASPDYAPRCNLTIKLVNNLGVPGNASFETGLISADVAWARAHPEDMGLYIHESVHIIQSYSIKRPEPWITEGIADWTRDYVYKDRVPTSSSRVYYIDGYSEAGFLLQHVKTNYDQQFIRKLNVASHKGTYNFDIFFQTTNKHPDQLWFDATGYRVPAGQVKGIANNCLDIPNAVTEDGTLLQISQCNNHSAQRWSIAPSRQSNLQKRITARGKCLDVQQSGTAEGTPVWLWSCNKSVAQEWIIQSDGTIKNPNANKCLSATNASGAPGTKLVVNTCNASSPQQIWNIPQ